MEAALYSFPTIRCLCVQRLYIVVTVDQCFCVRWPEQCHAQLMRSFLLWYMTAYSCLAFRFA